MKEHTSWEDRFNQEFSNVGWIPENKARIVSFIKSLLKEERENVLVEVRQKIQDIKMIKDGRNKTAYEIWEEVNRITNPQLQRR